jgi:hypothetical protein
MADGWIPNLARTIRYISKVPGATNIRALQGIPPSLAVLIQLNLDVSTKLQPHLSQRRA